MADRVELFPITIPAGVPANAPMDFPMRFNPGTVVEIDVKVPPGPAGNVGFYISAGGTQYVPRTAGTFLIPDDDYFTWPMRNAPNAGYWDFVAYNTDVNPHLIQVMFQIFELGVAGSTDTSSYVSV